MKSSQIWLWIIGLSISSFSCSTEQKRSVSAEPAQTLETIAVLGTNDIHGGLFPQVLKTRDSGTHNIRYEAGGAAVLATYINILRSEFGDHMIWLDGGDEFQGSIESNLELGQPMVQFFNLMGLNAAAIGNHEFDFGLQNLKTRMSEAKYPYLAANISEKSTGKPANFPNTYAHTLIIAGNLKVGVIGLSTLDTPTTTKAANVESLHFNELKESTLREAETLRSLGANIVVLTAHVGLKCDPPPGSTNRMMRKISDPQGICGERDEMVQLVHSLPAGTLDAVISGHSHQVVYHWIDGVPVIQGGAFGRYFNVVYLTYDWAQKKVVPDQTRIEGPIPVCAKVFQNQNDCNGDRPAPKTGRGPLIPAKFHGKLVEPDANVNSLISLVAKKTDAKKREKLGVAARPIENPRMSESELGNLVADAIRIKTKSDFSYINSGGIRAPLESGPITYGDVFRSFPFDNTVVTIQVKEKELRNILQVAQSGARGFGSVSGLKLRLIHPAYAAPFVDLSGAGTFEPWEANRLIDITFPNGEHLDPTRLYTFSTLDFLVTGGDDLKWPMSQIPPNRSQVQTGIPVREVLVQYIKEQAEINSKQRPLVKLTDPRLKFEKPKIVKVVHTKRRHRHRRHRSI